MSDEELTKAIYEAMQVPYLSERHDAIKQLITADRERVELEARIEALNGVQLCHRNTRTEIVSIVGGAILPIDDRIAELKAQQEEL